MKNLIKLLALINECWLNDEDYTYLTAKIQAYIDKKNTDISTLNNAAYHYMTLSDFKQAAICSRKADKIEANLDKFIDSIDSYKGGYIALNKLSF